MNVDLVTLLLLIAMAWIGVSYNMVWLTIIAVALAAVFLFSHKPAHKKGASSGKPKVRPIIVRRRYDGPDSIYPEKMKIAVQPDWGAKELREVYGETIGQFAGKVGRQIRRAVKL